jgi:hypothetical protein
VLRINRRRLARAPAVQPPSRPVPRPAQHPRVALFQ